MEVRDRLAKAQDTTRHVVQAVTDTDWDRETANEGWTVRFTLSHLLGAHYMMAAAASGTEMSTGNAGDFVGGDAVASYDLATAAARGGFAKPRVMDGEMPMPWGATPAQVCAGLLAMDTLVHGWDIARAIGAPMTVDDGLAADTLDFSVMVLSSPEARQRDFKDPVAIVDDSPTMDRLVAFLGRQP